MPRYQNRKVLRVCVNVSGQWQGEGGKWEASREGDDRAVFMLYNQTYLVK